MSADKWPIAAHLYLFLSLAVDAETKQSSKRTYDERRRNTDFVKLISSDFDNGVCAGDE